MSARRALGAAPVSALLALLLAGALAAQPSGLPAELERAGLDQRPGEPLPLDTELIDHEGRRVRLADYFGDRPALLVPVYYDCPMLCGLALDGLIRSLKAVPLEPGSDFNVIAVSFDSTEGSEQAQRRRSTALARYDRDGAESGLHFLTGSEAAVSELMAAIGFGYQRDETTGEFAHAAVVVVLTPEGRIARYFGGVEHPPRDLRLALVEAADDRIGGVVEQVLLFCFRYDPTVGRYTTATMNLVRAGGLLTLGIVGAFVILSLRRERRRDAAAEASA